MKGMANFLKRLFTLLTTQVGGETGADLSSTLQETIAKMDQDYADFRYNTAIAALMEFCNAWKKDKRQLALIDAKKVVALIAPLAPFMAEEMWQRLSDQRPETRDQQTKFLSVHGEAFPRVDQAALLDKPVTIVFMVNGKVRGSKQIPVTSNQTPDEATMIEMAKNEAQVAKWLIGKEIKKVVWVAPTDKQQGVVNLVVS
jgi:leucyl-tRNA synthetase